MLNSDFFDEDYYERGVSTGKSMYENYCWQSHIAFERASSLIALYPSVDTILDYGCAKGYVTYALRLLGKDAYGYDVSAYACENCRREIEPFIIKELSKWEFIGKIDLIYGKDVLEHIPKEYVLDELKKLALIGKEAFFIVPFGDNGKYRISEYHNDKSHIIVEDEEWWITQFLYSGFYTRLFSYDIPGFKDKWIKINKYGNGFFFLESKR